MSDITTKPFVQPAATPPARPVFLGTGAIKTAAMIGRPPIYKANFSNLGRVGGSAPGFIPLAEKSIAFPFAIWNESTKALSQTMDYFMKSE